MSDPIFGLGIQGIDNEPRPAVGADMSTVGLVFTAPDADPTTFPYGTMVRFFSDDTSITSKLGDAGTGKQAIELINQQLGELQVAAQIVGIRIEEGGTVAQTIANLHGSATSRTGMFALLNAGAELGVTPRLICVPGYTSQPIGFVSAVTVGTAGSDYKVGDAVSATGGGGSGFAAEVSEIDGAGGIVAVTITNAGSGYTAPPTLSVTSADGKSAVLTATVDTVSNAIVAALPTLLDQLLAVAVVDGPSTSLVDAEKWRETIQSKRIIPVEPGSKVVDDEGNVATVPAAPAIIGIAIRRDHEFQGRPFHSWANQPVRGIVGTARPIPFSILDGATEGQQLLAKNIGVIVRGESTDGAIADGGFVYVGTDTCSEDPLWTFYHQVRGRDYIHLMFIKTLRYFLGRRNIDRGTIEDILNTMTFALRDLQAAGDILGFRVGFTRDANSPEQLRLGRFKVSFAAEEPPVLRYLGVQSARYRPALDTLLSDLLTQLDVNA